MIVPDVDLLVYAYNPGAPRHADARRWWEGLVNGVEGVGIPWAGSTGFIRLSTSPRVLAAPWSPAAAVDQGRQRLTRDHINPFNLGERRLEYLERNLAVAGATANLATDAHIAALAMENGAEVHTNSIRDFQRFPGLLWRNPLL